MSDELRKAIKTMAACDVVVMGYAFFAVPVLFVLVLVALGAV